MTEASRDDIAPDYIAPYRDAVKQHGASFEATLWANRSFQRTRFAVFAEMFDFAGAVVVDAGAGKGDFARFLHEQGVGWARYVGVEGVAEMAAAGAALDLPAAEFATVDFVQTPDAFARFAPDVVVFSGSLNTFGEERALETLQRAWAACRRALLFNFLSTRHANPQPTAKDDPAKRMDPLSLLGWALDQTHNVRFRQEYLDGHDATIGMYKQPPSPPPPTESAAGDAAAS